MTVAFEKILYYFQYPLVRNALVVGVLIALCSSLVGVTLVLKRFSFIGDGLSHVAFGAVSVAAVVGLTDNMFVVLPVTILCAVLILRTGTNTKIRGDAVIAMVSVGALAVGYLAMNIFSASSNISGDVCTTLFGSSSILTLGRTEVLACVILSVAVITVFVLYYNRFFAVAFDEEFASAVGLKCNKYNLIMAVMIAVIVVLAMNLVGSLLVSALLIFPALSAMSIFRSFKSVTVFSAVLSVVCAVVGITVSVVAETPVGPTVVAVNIIAYIVCRLTYSFLK
ncbi:MAG: metal ABC transporter permease [Ruminococcaceae bacterium]|nr:metal ABC transporter permease [Oscillospiraceae bacterium]